MEKTELGLLEVQESTQHKKLLNNKLFKTALITKQEFPISRSKAKAENKIAK